MIVSLQRATSKPVHLVILFISPLKNVFKYIFKGFFFIYANETLVLGNQMISSAKALRKTWHNVQLTFLLPVVLLLQSI